MTNHGVWGINFEGVEANRAQNLPAGEYTFKIDETKRGTNKSGQPYLHVLCKVLQADHDVNLIGRIHYHYLGMDPKQLGWLKAFFEDIGAGSCLAKHRGPDDAVGTVFEATIKVKEGSDFVNLMNIVAIKAIDDDDEEEEPEEEELEERPKRRKTRKKKEVKEEVEEEEGVELEAPPKRKPSPRKAAAGRR